MNQAIDPKSFATLQAQAALMGCALQRIQDEGREVFIVSKWGLHRELEDKESLEQWLRRANGAHE